MSYSVVSALYETLTIEVVTPAKTGGTASASAACENSSKVPSASASRSMT
ncbi:unannotated protein [freshwater metagenome]|uniref:Unannotated protein n=1 Tax=freshwater metagenome TaxID=449393 RepID=A0A6J7W4F7_9ZZZZ